MAAENSEQAAAAEVERIEPPPNKLGLFQLYPASEQEGNNASIDIVAVHGLGGDPFGTWTAQDGTIWIRDLLSTLPSYQNARILTFGYNATAFLRPFKKATKGGVFTFAETLLIDLDDHRLSAAEKTRPIMFIGHSLGGIVIKSALRYAKLLPQFNSILSATRSIVFFGTPHQGADTAVWAALLGGIGKYVGVRTTQVVGELQRWSDPLAQLSREFSGLPGEYNIQITSYYETQTLYNFLIVPEACACMAIPQERARALQADHEMICKLSEADPNWPIVRLRYNAIAASIGLMQVLPGNAQEQNRNEPAIQNVGEFD